MVSQSLRRRKQRFGKQKSPGPRGNFLGPGLSKGSGFGMGYTLLAAGSG